jgi:hypothetical protein
MRGKQRVFIILMIISCFILTSCATTSFNTIWKDESYQGRMTNILVMAVSKQSIRKRFFEDEFVRQLNARGVSATQSYNVFPSDSMLDKNLIISKITDMGIDTFLITRMVDKKTVETYVPGTVYDFTPPRAHRSWHGYYASSYGAIYEPGYTIKNEVVVLETSLYDAKSEELIWFAMTETFIEGSWDKLVQDFINLIVKNFSDNDLLK